MTAVKILLSALAVFALACGGASVKTEEAAPAEKAAPAAEAPAAEAPAPAPSGD